MPARSLIPPRARGRHDFIRHVFRIQTSRSRRLLFGRRHSATSIPASEIDHAVLEERVAGPSKAAPPRCGGVGHAAQVVVFQHYDGRRRDRRGAQTLRGSIKPVHSRVQSSAGTCMGRPRYHRQFPSARSRPHTKGSHRVDPNPAAASPISRRSGKWPARRRAPDRRHNTLATPYLIRPIDHGATSSWHSLTKFLASRQLAGGIIVDAGTSTGRRTTIPDAERAAPRISRHQSPGDVRQFRFCDRLPRARLRISARRCRRSTPS